MLLDRRRVTLGSLAVAVAAVLFGTLGPVSRLASERAGVDAIGFVTWRALFGALVVGCLIAARAIRGRRIVGLGPLTEPGPPVAARRGRHRDRPEPCDLHRVRADHDRSCPARVLHLPGAGHGGRHRHRAPAPGPLRARRPGHGDDRDGDRRPRRDRPGDGHLGRSARARPGLPGRGLADRLHPGQPPWLRAAADRRGLVRRARRRCRRVRPRGGDRRQRSEP